MNNLDSLAKITCDPLSDKMKNGHPIDQPIELGNSIVCDGYISGKTTAIFTHFHDDHAWNFKNALRNCHHILVTEPTYLALKALQKFPDRPSIERLPYNRPFTTTTGETIELINANHVPGSCQVFVKINDTGEKILYSGDFSFPDISVPKADVLVLDGTHGTSLYDFDTDKHSVLRQIFGEVCRHLENDQPVEILANRGTMQDIMAQLEQTVDNEFIAEDIPFLADQKDVDLTNAIKYTYDDVEFRKLEVTTNSRLNELHHVEKNPYVKFSRPNLGTIHSDRVKIIQADVNPNFKTQGALWTDKNGKIYACLATHTNYKNILKYIDLVEPKKVIVDGTRANSDICKSLANTISKEFGIVASSGDCYK